MVTGWEWARRGIIECEEVPSRGASWLLENLVGVASLVDVRVRAPVYIIYELGRIITHELALIRMKRGGGGDVLFLRI